MATPATKEEFFQLFFSEMMKFLSQWIDKESVLLQSRAAGSSATPQQSVIHNILTFNMESLLVPSGRTGLRQILTVNGAMEGTSIRLKNMYGFFHLKYGDEVMTELNNRFMQAISKGYRVYTLPKADREDLQRLLNDYPFIVVIPICQQLYGLSMVASTK